MTEAKLDNHLITRGYLVGWREEKAHGEGGIWYFDLASREVKFSRGKKARFAIKRGIFAPNFIDGPDDRLENWFAKLENDLCDFARVWSVKTPEKVVPKRLKRALAGCISLGYRSEHGLEGVARAISATSPHMPQDEMHIALLNNCYQIIHSRVEKFVRGSAVIFRNMPGGLFTNDQPFLDWSPKNLENDIATFPLSPTAWLVLFPDDRKIPAGMLSITAVDASKKTEFADVCRKIVMHTARRWVVCSSSSDAEFVKSYLTPEKMIELRLTDRVLVDEIKELRQIFPGGNVFARRQNPGK